MFTSHDPAVLELVASRGLELTPHGLMSLLEPSLDLSSALPTVRIDGERVTAPAAGGTLTFSFDAAGSVGAAPPSELVPLLVALWLHDDHLRPASEYTPLASADVDLTTLHASTQYATVLTDPLALSFYEMAEAAFLAQEAARRAERTKRALRVRSWLARQGFEAPSGPPDQVHFSMEDLPIELERACVALEATGVVTGTERVRLDVVMGATLPWRALELEGAMGEVTDDSIQALLADLDLYVSDVQAWVSGGANRATRRNRAVLVDPLHAHAWARATMERVAERPRDAMTTLEVVFKDYLMRDQIDFAVRHQHVTALTQSERLLLNRSNDETRRRYFAELYKG